MPNGSEFFYTNWLEDIYIKFKKTELVEKKSHKYLASLRCSRPTHGRVQNLDPPFGPHLDPLEVEFKVKKMDLASTEATFALSKPKTNMLTNKYITFNCTARHSIILKSATLDQLQREFSFK